MRASDENRENRVNGQSNQVQKWNSYLKDFVLGGLFRECKVIFKKSELQYGGLIYNRVALHFKLGMPKASERFDLNQEDKELVESWWQGEAEKIIHKKLMEKKSNQMQEIRKCIKSKFLFELC